MTYINPSYFRVLCLEEHHCLDIILLALSQYYARLFWNCIHRILGCFAQFGDDLRLWRIADSGHLARKVLKHVAF